MPPAKQKLRYFHVSFFATVMGSAGLALSWKRAHEVLSMPALIGQVLTAVSVLLFVCVAILYALKLARFRPEVLEEWHHPIKLSFFPAFSISLLLMSMLLLDLSPQVSLVLWACGALVHLVLTVYVLTQWMHQTHFTIQHSTPAWFIPVVGNILVPIAGVQHGFIEASWFYFSIGLVYWLVLQVLVFNRVIFHDPMPAKLLPTLFILVAPPAVGFLSYMQLAGMLDAFARILYFNAAFLVLLLLTQFRRFLSARFYLSWWAYSFPLAAFSIASQVYFEHTANEFFLWIAYGSLLLASVVIGLLALRTVKEIANGSIFEPD